MNLGVRSKQETVCFKSSNIIGPYPTLIGNLASQPSGSLVPPLRVFDDSRDNLHLNQAISLEFLKYSLRPAQDSCLRRFQALFHLGVEVHLSMKIKRMFSRILIPTDLDCAGLDYLRRGVRENSDLPGFALRSE